MIFLYNFVVLVIACVSIATCTESIILGNQRLRDSAWNSIVGERVGILTNPTGIFADSLEHIVDVMAKSSSSSKSFELVAIFGPEHGFRGEKQAETGDPLTPYVDEQTGLPVYSAYALSVPQLADLFLSLNLTAMVVDMQDVGVRLYTFIWTMYNVMNATATCTSSAHSMKFIILDRPNPLSGVVVDGPMIDMSCCSSGYGLIPIPHIHGMTIGELGVLFNSKYLTSCADGICGGYTLEVIKMTGWKRSETWDEISYQGGGLPWVPPSPNIPTPTTAFAYASTCFIEATTAAEGRGTTTPFELFGAPFLPSPQVFAQNMNQFCLNELHERTACARAAYFQPTFSKYNNTVVPGIQWISPQKYSTSATTSSSQLKFVHTSPFYTATAILRTIMLLAEPQEAFQWDGSWFNHPGTELIDEYAGTSLYRTFLNNYTMSISDIYNYFLPETESFKQFRRAYLLYE